MARKHERRCSPGRRDTIHSCTCGRSWVHRDGVGIVFGRPPFGLGPEHLRGNEPCTCPHSGKFNKEAA